MEAAKRKWVKPDHKLTHEEIEDILEHWDYDPEHGEEYEEYNENGVALLDDKFGNPSYGSFEALYEKRHNISCGPMTLDEFGDWLDDVIAETDAERKTEMSYEAYRTPQQIPA